MTGFHLNDHTSYLFDSSQVTIDSVLCGTTVRAVVTKELVTVQQEHTEYVKVCPAEGKGEQGDGNLTLVAKSHHSNRRFHLRIDGLRDYHQ